MTGKPFSLARQSDLHLFLGILLATGAMCPKCGHGTRVTSKRWAKCVSCGERVRRATIEPCSASAPDPVQDVNGSAASQDGPEEAAARARAT